MTKYEEQLMERTARVGDKFILRGIVYQTISSPLKRDCTGCKFESDSLLCGRSPDCEIHDVVYIKEK